MKQLLNIGILLFFFFPLLGQEFIEGTRNGRQLIGEKRQLLFAEETTWEDRDSIAYEYDEQQRLIKKEELFFNDSILSLIHISEPTRPY